MANGGKYHTNKYISKSALWDMGSFLGYVSVALRWIWKFEWKNPDDEK